MAKGRLGFAVSNTGVGCLTGVGWEGVQFATGSLEEDTVLRAVSVGESSLRIHRDHPRSSGWPRWVVVGLVCLLLFGCEGDGEAPAPAGAQETVQDVVEEVQQAGDATEDGEVKNPPEVVL
ncbi:MAG: hypothetical protein VX938_07000, partial [Myxococcota bacterium]|nr:hypothetical protein [Myxococcota bacterium]